MQSNLLVPTIIQCGENKDSKMEAELFKDIKNQYLTKYMSFYKLRNELIELIKDLSPEQQKELLQLRIKMLSDHEIRGIDP